MPVYCYGKLIGHRTVYNDRLAMFILRNRLSDRFGPARAMSAMDKHTVARLKRQWLAERMREEDAEEQKTLDELDRWLGTMSDNRRSNMSPRARAAYDEADRIAREDGVEWMDAEIEEAEEAEFEACPEPAGEPEAKPAPEGGPRIRTVKDEGW